MDGVGSSSECITTPVGALVAVGPGRGQARDTRVRAHTGCGHSEEGRGWRMATRGAAGVVSTSPQGSGGRHKRRLNKGESEGICVFTHQDDGDDRDAARHDAEMQA